MSRDERPPLARPHEALVTTALDGRVLGFSLGAQALFGWREREILGRPLLDLLHEKHRAIDEQSAAEARNGSVIRDIFVKCVRRDGAVLSCLQTLLPMHDGTGRVHALARVLFDLTPLRDAELALRRMSAQVAALAAPADPAPSGSDLARRVARERERTRDQLLRVVASESVRLGALCTALSAAAARARVPSDRSEAAVS